MRIFVHLRRQSRWPLQPKVSASTISSGASTRRRHQSQALRSEDMAPMPTGDRLAHLRELMKKNEIDVYIVPSWDSHQSEYTAPCDKRRHFISGFTGSAGTAVVTLEKAALATDGRYFNQASKELDENWELLKQGLQDVPTWQEWTADQSKDGKVVGVDPSVLTASDARKLSDKIKRNGGKELKGVSPNLVDVVWGKDRPARPNEKIIVLDKDFAGKSVKDKLTELRAEIEKKKCSGFFVSMLDEIAWLYNLRGNDIPFNPVFFSYASITADSAVLFVDCSKLDEKALSHLGDDVTIKPYDEVFNDAKALGESVTASAKEGTSRRKVMMSTEASWALYKAIGGEENVEETRSPISDAKAVKNMVELMGIRDCNVRDGAALIQYFAWLEDQLVNKKAKISEVDGADKLENLRSKKNRFMGLSFEAISSTGPNAAVIHYTADRETCSIIDPDQIYLCDSGAQYLDGTTDTTRTLHFGKPTEAEKNAYTLVLKGNLALENIKFPKGTTGFAIDSIARQFLWSDGLDYRHGTGHGVGSFLNVHEGPIGIGTRVQYTDVPLSPGNVISNEPGYYEDGNYGIRIENVVVVTEVETKHKFGDKPWLGFYNVTMVPHCRNLIDISLLTKAEIEHIDKFHAEVEEKTKGYFKGDELTLEWLRRETRPLQA